MGHLYPVDQFEPSASAEYDSAALGERGMILAFGHKARQGKDTAAEAVVEYFNKRRQLVMDVSASKQRMFGPNADKNSLARFERDFPAAKLFKFADELYRICREEYGMTDKDAPLLQKIGDGRREKYGLDYWIKQLEPKIKAFKGIAVISDARYKNEADWIVNNGGQMVNVRRLNSNGTPFIADDRDPNFISEVQLDSYCYDFYIVCKTGQAGLVADQAITIAEYIRALER